ncbi:NAC domain-containing protein 83-like [Vitis riparia]|uniref:NAC domain-containing protein 83-like n=1 Tax=Vitis riparia TaxID=96939 RepID=UPI00155A91FC|nr:NAC domain-containing protein 83-like [Vitis riparia]
MEKFNFVRDGVIRLPLGFRFQPTDEELVFQYLKCKVFSRPLPASIIPEINVSKYDPWDFPGDLEQEKYFFSNKEAKYQIGNRSNRATSSGYWKASGTDKQITSSRNSQLVGMKKTLVFYRGKPPYDSRTDWVMHEYRLLIAGAPEPKNTPSSSSIQMEDWVLCRVFLKRRTRAEHHEATESCSSGITEISSSESDHEESSSTAGYNFFH